MARIFRDLGKLAAEMRRQQRRGRRIVFVNGCFDLLHGGHASYLEEAATHGDLLVCGVNSDASVRELKGEGRPICNEEERLAVLAALRCVDYLIVFEEQTCERLLRTLRPDVHAKGTDYTVDTVPERVVSDELGIETVIAGDPKENATKAIIRKVRQGSGR